VRKVVEEALMSASTTWW